jgi:hypothetical protein
VFKLEFALTEAYGNIPSLTARPTHYLAAHSCAIRSIAFVVAPPSSISLEADGAFDLSGDPVRVAAVGYDGSTTITDLREADGAGTAIFLHERCEFRFLRRWLNRIGS